jgi:thiol-disulfide isomerase/thioredoxin
MKYLEVDPEVIEEYVAIWLEFAMALNPHIDEIAAKDVMEEFLALNPRIYPEAAAYMGQLVKATENTWHTRETH